MNLAFELAFGHILAVVPQAEWEAEAAPVAPIPPPNRDDEDLDFGLLLIGRDNDDSVENEDIYDEDEGNVGFGSLDLYHAQELIELSLEDAGVIWRSVCWSHCFRSTYMFPQVCSTTTSLWLLCKR